MNIKLLETYNQSRDTPNKSIICHAPFVSLNFEQNGNVTACCYNRKFVLGTYPKSSIKNIWEGEKAQELRTYIEDNDLSHGCELCLHQLESQNFSGMRARGYDAYAQQDADNSTYTSLRPKVFEFELSNTCNLECTMCNGHFSSSIRKNREKQPPKENPYNTEFVQQLEAFLPTLEVAKFLGGEPFLIDMYYDIWDKMIELNPNIKLQITTNCTILNNKVKETLEILESDLIISIDSIVKETYESIRKNASYERVMDNLEYFITYCEKHNTKLYFAVCPIRKNWEEIPGLISFCNQKGITIFFNTVLNPIGQSLSTYSTKKLKAIKQFYESIKLPVGNQIERDNQLAFQGLLNQVVEWYDHAKSSRELRPSLHKEIQKKSNNLFFIFENIHQDKPFLQIELIREISHIYAVRTEMEPRFKIKDKYYQFYLKSLNQFTTNLLAIMDNYPHVQDLEHYISAIQLFHQEVYEEEEKDLTAKKLNELKRSIQFVPNPSAMYNEFIRIDPTKLISSTADLNLNDVLAFTINRYPLNTSS